jgi:enoyl-[acyl-carrier protein] reductase II
MNCSLANTGQVAGRIGDVRPVAEIIHQTWTGCLAALDAARRRLGVAGDQLPEAIAPGQ